MAMIELKVTMSDAKEPNKVREAVLIMLKDIIESSKQKGMKVTVNVNSNRLGYALVHIEPLTKESNMSHKISNQFFSITTEIVKFLKEKEKIREIQILNLSNEETKHYLYNSFIGSTPNEENYITIK